MVSCKTHQIDIRLHWRTSHNDVAGLIYKIKFQAKSLSKLITQSRKQFVPDLVDIRS